MIYSIEYIYHKQYIIVYNIKIIIHYTHKRKIGEKVTDLKIAIGLVNKYCEGSS